MTSGLIVPVTLLPATMTGPDTAGVAISVERLRDVVLRGRRGQDGRTGRFTRSPLVHSRSRVCWSPRQVEFLPVDGRDRHGRHALEAHRALGGLLVHDGGELLQSGVEGLVVDDGGDADLAGGEERPQRG